jgi:hypothetical protein
VSSILPTGSSNPNAPLT